MENETLLARSEDSLIVLRSHNRFEDVDTVDITANDNQWLEKVKELLYIEEGSNKDIDEVDDIGDRLRTVAGGIITKIEENFYDKGIFYFDYWIKKK